MSDALTASSAAQKAATVGLLAAPGWIDSFATNLPLILTLTSTLIAIVIGIQTCFKMRRDSELAIILKCNAEKDSIIKDEQIKAMQKNTGKVRRVGDPEPEGFHDHEGCE